MNGFERGLQEARARQQRLYLLAFAALVLGCIAVLGAVIYASGTAVAVLPDEAAGTAAVSVEEGFAISLDEVVYGFARAPTILVRADGFRDERRTIRPDERGGRVEVRLVPLPGRAVVTTTPARPNTRWELDGTLLAIGERLDRELEAGRYALRIDNPHFALVERGIEVSRGATAEMAIELEPVEGRLTVSTEPAGAAVTLDGRVVGESPLALPVEGGEHRILVAGQGHVPVEDVVEVTRDEPAVERRYRLKPVAAGLVVLVEPAGGHLLLDGREVAPSIRHDVASGRDHTVTYMLDGHRPATRTVTLEPNEERRLTLRAEAEYGEVEIHAGPAADIFIDGARVGQGAFAATLAAVPHRVELRKPGYRTIGRTVTPSGGRRTVIREELVTELAARRAESPREYRNAAGMELKLFDPDTFVMGAPRHQPGQRANEFEKTVALRKAFYAGKHEVTNEQFGLFRNGHSGPAGEPVTAVSWAEAAAFCNWLSAKEELQPFYRIEGGRIAAVNAQADGYRLLSEAEWEWLARKAGKDEQSVFPWGDESVVPAMAGNIADEASKGLTSVYVPGYNDGYAGVAPVGRFAAEASGLFDLAGNVSEWVHDFYSLEPPAAGAVHVDPLGPDYGDTHVVKGASWRAGTRTLLRAAYRDGLADRRDDVGFRIGRYLYGAETNSPR